MTDPILHGIKEKLRHSALFPLLRRRRFQAYCVGGPKTGTTSLAQLFEGNYLASHEPLHARTMERVLASYESGGDRNDLARYLRWRDRELYLEMESSHLVVAFIATLVELFPQAKYILTVREPRSWLNSMLDQQLNGREQWARQTAPGPRAKFFPALHRHLLGGEQHRRWPGEEVLKEHALYPLDAYLAWWADHNRRVLQTVPPERLLVLPTNSISRETSRIAEFVGAPVASLSRRGEHSNRAPKKHQLVDRIDPSLLADRIAQQCTSTSDLIRQALPIEMGVGDPGICI